MLLTARVKLFVAEKPESPIPNVKVSMYDRDEGDEDDLLATEMTDENGEIFFGFDSDLSTAIEAPPQWKTDSLPDLYVMVYDAQDRIVLSTREQTVEDKLVSIMEVAVSEELVRDHNL